MSKQYRWSGSVCSVPVPRVVPDPAVCCMQAELLLLSNNKYTPAEILKSELELANGLGWALSSPSACEIMEHLLVYACVDHKICAHVAGCPVC